MQLRKAARVEWKKRFSGPNAEVWMHDRCAKEMENLGKSRAPIEACMDNMYCRMERADQIPKAKLNRNEGRRGKNKPMIQAFKNKKYGGRVYGIEGSIRGKRAFFAALATIKKKPKADPVDLDTTAERVERVSELVPDACV